MEQCDTRKIKMVIANSKEVNVKVNYSDEPVDLSKTLDDTLRTAISMTRGDL